MKFVWRGERGSEVDAIGYIPPLLPVHSEYPLVPPRLGNADDEGAIVIRKGEPFVVDHLAHGGMVVCRFFGSHPGFVTLDKDARPADAVARDEQRARERADAQILSRQQKARELEWLEGTRRKGGGIPSELWGIEQARRERDRMEAQAMAGLEREAEAMLQQVREWRDRQAAKPAMRPLFEPGSSTGPNGPVESNKRTAAPKRRGRPSREKAA